VVRIFFFFVHFLTISQKLFDCSIAILLVSVHSLVNWLIERDFMKMLVCGVFNMSGSRKSDGAPYSMTMLHALQPIENVSSDKMKKIGYGFEPAQIACDDSVVHMFKGSVLPAEYDLITDMRLRSGKLEPFIVGVSD
jgi:hypothetical protein